MIITCAERKSEFIIIIKLCDVLASMQTCEPCQWENRAKQTKTENNQFRVCEKKRAFRLRQRNGRRPLTGK